MTCRFILTVLLTFETLTCVSGALFGMLDTEVDRGLRSGIQDCLTSMLQTLAPDNLTHWLGLCKSVLSAAKTEDENKGGKGKMASGLQYIIPM